MEYLTTEDLIALASDLGVGPNQDLGLVDSAAYRPSVSVFGRDAYPDIDAKAGVLLESIVGNHPLVDGSKRLGRLAVVVRYGLDDIDLWAPDDDAYDLVIAVASGTAGHEVATRHWPMGISLANGPSGSSIHRARRRPAGTDVGFPHARAGAPPRKSHRAGVRP